MIIDTHAHFDDEAFDTDRDDLLSRLYKEGIKGIVNIGADIKSSMASIELAGKYSHVFAAVGIHPSYTGNISDNDIEKLRSMAKYERVLAIGEIGLDKYWNEPDVEIQKKWFVKQLELARECSLPIVIHSRDAAKDTFDIMKENKAGDIGGVIHCYSYGVDMAREFLNMGFFLGIGGVSTFKNAKKIREVIEYTPLDRIVIETDSPYLAPTPHRGKRNDSSYLKYVIEVLAKIKNKTAAQIETITEENAYVLYPKMKQLI